MKDKNYITSILDTYKEVKKYNQQIDEKLISFITKCLEFEKLSEHKYEIQRTFELNKIYFQGYVLDSEICKYLKDNVTNNYSIKQLRIFINQYENNSNEDLSTYYMVLDLYEQADSIEDLIDTKVEYEIKRIYELTSIIGDIENVENDEYEMLYNKIKSEIKSKYLSSNLIDDNSFSICVQILNDIFNYFISGL